jgi:hypothetical protein
VAVLALITALIRAVVHSIRAGVGHETDVLDLTIHSLLQQTVKPRASLFDLTEVGQYRPDGDGVLVTAEIGQPEFFGVIGFEDDSHDVSFRLWW